MGRIKTKLMKRHTFDIYEKYGNKVSKDFAENKQMLPGIAEVHSKKIRNIIAGYLTRMAKRQET